MARAICVFLLFSVQLSAFSFTPPGPDWIEGSQGSGDAGDLPANAQVPHGQPPFTPMDSISGSLSAAASLGGDFQDMYYIRIAEVAEFGAFANPPVNAPAGPFNTQLWLFKLNGTGVLANDGIGLDSGFGAVSNDGSGAAVTAPGLYLIAVSGVPSDPVDSANNLLFDQATPGEISGPDGPGGGNAIAGWSADGATGTYTIHFGGVTFFPCVGDATFDGFVNVDDLAAVVFDWGPCPVGSPCAGDVNIDGEVDVDDLITVVLHWSTCVPVIEPVAGR